MSTKAEKQGQIEQVWRASFQSELNNRLQAKLRSVAMAAVKTSLEAGLRQELSAHLGVGAYERAEAGGPVERPYRSGYYERGTTTDHGYIPDLRVPKLRWGNKARVWQILSRYQSSLGYMLDSWLYLDVLGLSLRDLQEALYVLYGHMLSVNAINQITLEVQTTVKTAQNQALGETPPVLIIDGVWVKVLYPTGQHWLDQSGHRRQERRVQQRVILAALAVWPDGRSELVHYELASAEDEASWRTFWQHLRARGLDPAAVKLVVSDGAKGVLAAMTDQLPQAKLQRCTVHKIRGFERYLTYKDLPKTDPTTDQPWSDDQARAQRRIAIATAAHHIFKAPTRAEADRRFDAFVTTWQPLEPRAVRNFSHGLKRCFEFYAFDPTLHTQIHSTNLLERFFREFRAKTDEIGSFPNETSCLTLFHLVLVRDHAKHHRFHFANN